MAVPDWSFKSPEWPPDAYYLLKESLVKSSQTVSLQDLINKSDQIRFPVNTGRCKILKKHVSIGVLERNINSAYPLIHENALELCCKFILHKRKHGTRVEKVLYKNLNLIEFIDRLLKKRAVMFRGNMDRYMILGDTKGQGNWESIGTDMETSPLLINDVISYDEIKLSAFLSVSSYTYFVNKGDRNNMAKFSSNRGALADEGIIIGAIGPRLRKVNVMEYQEIVASKTQNTKQNGYGTKVVASVHKLFCEFFDEKCLDYEETLNFKNSVDDSNQRFVQLNPNSLFDNHCYYKRLTVSIDTLLLEANYRAKEAGTTAFVHVIRLGLGAWRISLHQDAIYMDVFAKRISLLGTKLNAISDICFAWITQDNCGNYKNGEKFQINGHSLGGINILINKRYPHEKLNKEKLLVVSYASDGNAWPGNKYWSGKLRSSSDSAEACASSTQIAELHNPHINSLVSANNLRIVTGDDVVTFEKYQEMIRYKNSKRKC